MITVIDTPRTAVFGIEYSYQNYNNNNNNTVQPVHTGPCTNQNPVYTVIIIWSGIHYTQNNTN